VPTNATISLTFSAPVSLQAAAPTLSPAIAGKWVQKSPTTLTYALDSPLIPASQIVVTIPGGSPGYAQLNSIKSRNGYTRTIAYNGSNQVSTVTNGLQTDPTSGKPVSTPTETQTSTETAAGGATAGGTLGTPTATGNTGSGNYSNSSSTTNYATGTVTQTQKNAPGAVESQSIAVLVNQKSVPKGVSLATLKEGVAAAAHRIEHRPHLFHCTLPRGRESAQEDESGFDVSVGATCFGRISMDSLHAPGEFVGRLKRSEEAIAKSRRAF